MICPTCQRPFDHRASSHHGPQCDGCCEEKMKDKGQARAEIATLRSHLANIAPPSPCPDCLALAKVMLQYFGQVDNTNRCLGEGVTYDLLKAFVKEREP